jgi:hypothetical protein
MNLTAGQFTFISCPPSLFLGLFFQSPFSGSDFAEFTVSP